MIATLVLALCLKLYNLVALYGDYRKEDNQWKHNREHE